MYLNPDDPSDALWHFMSYEEKLAWFRSDEAATYIRSRFGNQLIDIATGLAGGYLADYLVGVLMREFDITQGVAEWLLAKAVEQLADEIGGVVGDLLKRWLRGSGLGGGTGPSAAPQTPSGGTNGGGSSAPATPGPPTRGSPWRIRYYPGGLYGGGLNPVPGPTTATPYSPRALDITGLPPVVTGGGNPIPVVCPYPLPGTVPRFPGGTHACQRNSP